MKSLCLLFAIVGALSQWAHSTPVNPSKDIVMSDNLATKPVIQTFMIILYVANQEKSKAFYQQVFDEKPSLDVPGMTMFNLPGNIQLGLMPEIGIAPILGNSVPHPSTGNGIPRCELYLFSSNPNTYLERTVKAGGKVLSELQKRPWGDIAGYGVDLDGHVLAFAQAN